MNRNTQTLQAFNVLTAALIIAFVLIAISILIVTLITKNVYLSAYYALAVFFTEPNSQAEVTLANFAFMSMPAETAAIIIIEIIDDISRILIISFVVAAVVDFVSFANVEGFVNRFIMKGVHDHVIICGYNEITESLIKKLKAEGRKYVVVVQHVEKALALGREGTPAIIGRYTDEDALGLAGIRNASAIVFLSPSDLENTIGAMTAKHLNPKVKVISRATDEDTRTKMYRLGVDMCILPEHIAGIKLGEDLAKAVMK